MGSIKHSKTMKNNILVIGHGSIGAQIIPSTTPEVIHIGKPDPTPFKAPVELKISPSDIPMSGKEKRRLRRAKERKGGKR